MTTPAEPEDQDHGTTADWRKRHELEHLFADQASWLLAYAKTLDRLYGSNLAEDVVSDAFAILLERPRLLTTVDNVRAYLAGIVRHRHARLSRNLQRETPSWEPPDEVEQGPSPDEAVERREARARVLAAIGQLPEMQRAVLMLRIQELSFREIADLLDLSEPAVRQLMLRSRRALRAVLKNSEQA